MKAYQFTSLALLGAAHVNNNNKAVAADDSSNKGRKSHLRKVTGAGPFDDGWGEEQHRALTGSEPNVGPAGRSVNVSQATLDDWYDNEYDRPFDFGDESNKTTPLCGVYSIFDDYYKDRRFRFRTCNIDETVFTNDETARDQITVRSAEDREFVIRCDGDKVMTRLKSDHDDETEDRWFQAHCTHFKNTKVGGCTGYQGWMNFYEDVLDFTCPAGKVITGIRSQHSDEYEDRRFKFNCCELQVELGMELDLKEHETNEVHSYNDEFEVTAQVDNQDAAICGMASIHDNNHEDRQFRFTYCKPRGSVSLVGVGMYGPNKFDKVSKVDCPSGSFVNYLHSSYDGHYHDRQFKYECGRFVGYTTDMCHWTHWANEFDEPSDLFCGTQHVLGGIWSRHDDQAEDRRFKFKCCRLIKE